MRAYATCVALLLWVSASASADPVKPAGVEFMRDSRVMLMNADGSAQHRSKLPSYAYWSPDGARVVFARPRRGQFAWPQLYIARADGREQRKVPNVYAQDGCFGARWSPTGAQVAFLTGCENVVKRVFIVRRAGTRPRLLARHLLVLQARWSRRGRAVVFAGSPKLSVRYALFVADARTGKIQRVPGPRFDFHYSADWGWSGDGKRVYLLADTTRAHAGLELSSLSLRGGPRQQMSPPDLNVGGFEVSPDGRQIALQASAGSRDWEIYLMRPDGSGLRQLTDNRALDRGPHWSPDGRRILFTRELGDNSEIYVIGADGTHETNLSRNPAWDEQPSWVPVH
jgi:Tol biopolymer transport system component